jgi:hypothetical protein
MVWHGDGPCGAAVRRSRPRLDGCVLHRIAFALHLDTFRILSQLAAKTDLRAQVASASGALQQVAGAKLNAAASQANTPANVQAQQPPDPKAVHPPQLYRDAMTRVARLKAVDVPGAFSDRQPRSTGSVRRCRTATQRRTRSTRPSWRTNRMSTRT